MSGPDVAVVSERTGGDVVVTVTGEIDLASVPALERELAAAISNDVENVEVDLGGVTYLDSVGVRVLFNLVSRMETAQIRLRFSAPTGSPARRVMELSGFPPVVAIDPPA